MVASSRLPKSLRLQLTALIGLSLVASATTHAQWTGATTDATNDSLHSYTTTTNWTGGIVQDTFAPTLTGATTIYFGENYTTSGVFNLNYGGAFNLTLSGGGLVNGAGGAVTAADRTITLNGNVNADFTGGTQTVTVGSSTAGSALNFDLNGSTRSFTVAASDTLSLLNAIQGTGGLTKLGAGSLILQGASSYTGLTTVTAGDLNIRNNTALGGTGVSAGTTVTGTANAASLSLQNTITVTGELLTISGDGNGTGTAAGTSGGVLRNISGSNTWTGAITVLPATTTRINSNAGTLTITGNIAMSTTATDQLVLQGAGNGVISGNLTGNSRLTKGTNGGGTWVLSGTNDYTGSTTLSAGSLQFAKRVSLYNADTSKWTAANLSAASGTTYTFNIGGVDEFTSADILQLNGAINFATNARLGLDTTNAGGSFTYSNVISNSTSSSLNFLKTGTGNLTLSADNTFSGTIGVNAGTLTLTGANSFTGTATASGGILNVQHANALGTTAAGVSVSGAGGQLQLQGGITITGESLSIANDATNGTGAVLNVSGNNFWTGNLTISPSTTNNIPRIAANANSKLTFSGNVSITSGTEQAVLAQGDGTIEYTGIISGTGARVTKSSGGTGTLILSGANSYTGATQISGGTVLVNTNAPSGADGAFGNATSNVNISTTSSQAPRLLTNGAFTIGRNITTAASGGGTILGTVLGGNAAANSAFTGNITMGTGAPMTLSQVAGGSVTFSGALTGSSNVIVGGAGTVILDTTAKAYTGTTTVDSLAKLLVNTNVASPTVTVNGTLGGSGTLSGVVNVGASGIIAPGNSAGTLTTGALTLDALSILNYELATPGIVGSNINDLLTVNGALNLSGTLNVTALTGFGEGTYRLIDYTGAYDNGILTVGTMPPGYIGTVDTSVANQVNLVVTAIPEPSTFVLGAVGILGFAILRRRRAG